MRRRVGAWRGLCWQDDYTHLRIVIFQPVEQVHIRYKASLLQTEWQEGNGGIVIVQYDGDGGGPGGGDKDDYDSTLLL